MAAKRKNQVRSELCEIVIADIGDAAGNERDYCLHGTCWGLYEDKLKYTMLWVGVMVSLYRQSHARGPSNKQLVYWCRPRSIRMLMLNPAGYVHVVAVDDSFDNKQPANG